ncbi:MAG: hypothetical protein KGZ85_07325 [Ignavibacterium sp.]|nr:hypothetical protein [Ignavibacterium sp.]
MSIKIVEETNFKSTQEAFEYLALIFDRISGVADTAIVINDYKYGDFEDPLCREDRVSFQLEIIRDLAKQFTKVCDNIPWDLGQPANLSLKSVDKQPQGNLDALPECKASAVLTDKPKSLKNSPKKT